MEKKIDANSYSPLALAYIGDAVYELYIRNRVIAKGNMPVNKLHGACAAFACAPMQAKMIKAIADDLTDEEASIYRRGKNAKPYTKAKNASFNEYHHATGFEALVGYLHILGNEDRIAELIELAASKVGAEF